jgi:hypothetical protein
VKGGLEMHRFRNSWFLARFDLIRHGWGYIFSILFFGYASGMVVFMLQNSSSTDKSSFTGINLIIDFDFLCFLGISGFAFASRYYLGYWRSKSFSKKAIFLKSFPISARDTIESKILLVVIHVLGQGGLFLSAIYFVPSPIKQMLNMQQFLEFIIMWLAYAFIWGSIYAYMEISLSEKAYLWGSFWIVLFFMLITFLCWLADYHILQHSIDWIQHYGILAVLISLILSGFALITFRAMGIKKIHTRDLKL